MALYSPQQARTDILARVDWYGWHATAAFDAQMRAALPALGATEGPQDAPKVLRGHEIMIAAQCLMCLDR